MQYIGEELERFWVILGRIRSILGQKSALPNLLKYTIVLYAYSVFNVYFTVLNVPNDRMTRPCKLHTPPFQSQLAADRETEARGQPGLPFCTRTCPSWTPTYSPWYCISRSTGLQHATLSPCRSSSTDKRWGIA